MFAGFDYGTSNCAVGVMEAAGPRLLTLGEHGRYMPSAVYAPAREIIVDWLANQVSPTLKTQFQQQRQLPLQIARRAKQELILDGYDTELSFGRAALNAYLDEPEEGYYLKSPKSFLGATGLKAPQIALFEDIVGAMMVHIKQQAETTLDASIDQVVIGRPVNFQGLRGEESNQQALAILQNAARYAGFKEVAFQFEPLAAGFDYEAELERDQQVLIVDIGGGTTDCSVLRMGPSYRDQVERQQDVLGHTGERVGGNDFDIHFALRGLMPNLGLDSMLESGKPMPAKPFWDAVAINDVGAQTQFYSADTARLLDNLRRDAAEPALIQRLQRIQAQKQSHQLVNVAEQGKIALSEQTSEVASLAFIESGLSQALSRAQFADANQAQLGRIRHLMQEALAQAQCQPDVVFVTGGTAKSPVIQQFLQTEFADAKIVVGDHFGNVSLGLTRWAARCFA